MTKKLIIKVVFMVIMTSFFIFVIIFSITRTDMPPPGVAIMIAVFIVFVFAGFLMWYFREPKRKCPKCNSENITKYLCGGGIFDLYSVVCNDCGNRS